MAVPSTISLQSKAKKIGMRLENPRSGSGPRQVVRVTSYDVAKLAGVSQSAVSRAFRQGGSISRETRAKVEEAARSLGYAPSKLARSLITQRTRMVGVVMTELTARNYPDVLRFLSNEIQALGNRMLLCTVPDDSGAAAGLEDLLAYQVDGIISSALPTRDCLEAAHRRGVPVVLYNRAALGVAAAAVACDHPAAMDALADILVAGVASEVVFIAGPQTAPISNDRLKAVETALSARGSGVSRVLYSDYSYEGGRAQAIEAVSGGRPPDTLICANDAMALGVMDALRFDLGLRVPEDVAVTGFDDVRRHPGRPTRSRRSASRSAG